MTFVREGGPPSRGGNEGGQDPGVLALELEACYSLLRVER
jgi:hypothetical protein